MFPYFQKNKIKRLCNNLAISDTVTSKRGQKLNLRTIKNFRKVVRREFNIHQGKVYQINVIIFTKRQKGCFFKVLPNFKYVDQIKILRKILQEWNNCSLKSL